METNVLQVISKLQDEIKSRQEAERKYEEMFVRHQELQKRLETERTVSAFSDAI
jgi:hypothetical protein